MGSTEPGDAMSALDLGIASSVISGVVSRGRPELQLNQPCRCRMAGGGRCFRASRGSIPRLDLMSLRYCLISGSTSLARFCNDCCQPR